MIKSFGVTFGRYKDEAPVSSLLDRELASLQAEGYKINQIIDMSNNTQNPEIIIVAEIDDILYIRNKEEDRIKSYEESNKRKILLPDEIFGKDKNTIDNILSKFKYRVINIYFNIDPSKAAITVAYGNDVDALSKYCDGRGYKPISECDDMSTDGYIIALNKKYKDIIKED